MSFVSAPNVQFALQAYLLYIKSLMQNKRIKMRLYEKQQQEAIQLMENLVVKTIDESSALEALNDLIFEINKATLKEDFVAYPHLALTYPVLGIKEEILAFQHFLKEKIGNRQLQVDSAEQLLNEATAIWLKVGTFLDATKSIQKFYQLIEKTNTYLPYDDHYPLPPTSRSETH